MWAQIGMGIVDGLIYAFSGKLKNAGQPFDWRKLWPTVLLSAVVGGVAAFLGMEYNAVYSDALVIGSTAVLQNLWKALSRRWNF